MPSLTEQLEHVRLAPFKKTPVWYFQTKDEEYAQYTTKINRIIQKAYELRKPSVRISRVIDGVNVQYDIIFAKMVQVEVIGSFARKVRFEMEYDLPPPQAIPLEPLTLQQLQQLRGEEKYSFFPAKDLLPNAECIVCLETFSEMDPAVCLEDCKMHGFHAECLASSLKTRPICPLCRVSLPERVQIGACPDGVMTITYIKSTLGGYDDVPTIMILFDFPSGISDERHPNPGIRYPWDQRVHYMPATKEGRQMVGLFKIAWHQRLLFQVGNSLTTGNTDVVVYAGIHMKSSRENTTYGWPDATYFYRLNEEMYEAGVRVLPEHTNLYFRNL